jgi:hypothetical protein
MGITKQTRMTHLGHSLTASVAQSELFLKGRG